MKRLISSLSLMLITVIFCSIQATAQNHRGNGHHNGNWGNNGNYNNNNNCNNNNYNNHHGGNHGHGYRNNNHCHGSGYSFSYTYAAPCAPRTVVVYRSNQCAPRPNCRRW